MHWANLNYTAQDSMLRNGRRLREINQSYVKTLREVLLQLCQAKTTQEIQALTISEHGDAFVQHTLVKRHGAPQAEEVNDIMTAMFGYEAKHYGAQDYAVLMQKNLTSVSIDSDAYPKKLQAKLCVVVHGNRARCTCLLTLKKESKLWRYHAANCWNC